MRHAGDSEFTDDMKAIWRLGLDNSLESQAIRTGMILKQILPVKFSKPASGLTKQETQEVGDYLYKHK